MALETAATDGRPKVSLIGAYQKRSLRIQRPGSTNVRLCPSIGTRQDHLVGIGRRRGEISEGEGKQPAPKRRDKTPVADGEPTRGRRCEIAGVSAEEESFLGSFGPHEVRLGIFALASRPARVSRLDSGQGCASQRQRRMSVVWCPRAFPSAVAASMQKHEDVSRRPCFPRDTM